MSFVTRCPACATQFRVVADQLKISDGWVRCGHCAEVFDARLDLSPWPPALALAPEPPLEPPLELPAETLSAKPEPESEPESESESESESEPAQAPVLAPWPEPEPQPEVVADDDVSFLRQARRRAFWRRRGVRWGLALASVGLVLALGLQWVVHERHRIAALRPDLKPLLVALCQPLGCEIEPLRWIAALAIDSSTLVQRGAGRYGFEVVLKNTSLFELAVPALELSLTDARDQLLLRRVVLPQDWSDSPGGLAPQDSRTLRLVLQVDADTARLMAGYRTVAFYP